MNHLYKTIFNKRTEQITVVSEKTSTNCQGQQEKAIQPQVAKKTSLTVASPQFLKKQLTLAMSVLLSGLLGQMSYAATITQSYTGTESLTNSSVLTNGFKDLINNPDGDKKGIVVLDTSNNAVPSDAVLTIDYSNSTIPKPVFVVAGYATFNKNDPSDYDPAIQAIDIGRNQIILTKGDINGSVYAGLIQHTQKTADIDCALDSTQCNDNTISITKSDQFQNIQINNNKNTISTEKESSILIEGDLTTGQNLIHLQYGDFNANNANANAYANAYVSDNTLTSNENKISILGETTTQNINAGQNLIHLQYGDLNANISSAHAYAFNNTLTSNNNDIVIDGGTTTQNINAGQNLIHLQYGDFNAHVANANAFVYAYDNTLTSNENKISILGETTTQNINAGQNLIHLQYGDFNTNISTAFANANPNADAYNNTLTSNENKISILGETTTQNINAGQNLIHLQYGDFNTNISTANANAYASANVTTSANTYDNTLTSNENKISILGETTTQNINAGQNLIHLQYGDLNSKTANANAYASAASASNNQFSANENTISISGTTTAQNINAGHAGIKLEYGNITAGQYTQIINGVSTLSYGQASLNINLGNTSFEAHQNEIDLKGKSIISGDIKTGQIDFYLGYNSLKNGDDTEALPLLYLNGNNNYLTTYLRVKNNSINLNGTKAFSNNNTISIEGEHTFVQADIQDPAFPDDLTKTIKGDYGSIYGGYLNYNKDKEYFIANAESKATTDTSFVRPETYDVFTGNTLNYNNSVPITVKEIGNFQTYNFTLNPELADNATALIKANKIILGSSDDNMSANQVQKQIYNSVSTAVQNSVNLGIEIKTALPSIADDDVNPNYVISDHIKDVVLNAEDISQSVKNLLTTGKIASDIRVVGIQSGKLLDTNTKFILMQADQGQLLGLGQGYLSKGIAQQGISLLYDVETSVDQANDQVIALINTGQSPTDPTPTDPTPTDPTPTDPVQEDPQDLEPTGPKVNPQLKALLKGNLSGLMLLTRSEDQFSNYSFDQEHLRGLVPFVIASGNHSRYDTGSHIKSNGGLFTIGFSVFDDDWTWGAFIENGWDSYKTHDSFKDAKTVNGRGHNRFNGVGFFSNYDFNNGWYVDGTLRGGRLHTSFETDDLRNAVTNERAEYDISSNYYGVSLKGGYNFIWNPQNELDLSAKYAWVGTESHRLMITGDPIDFNKLNSHRLGLNAENSYQMNSDFNVLTGLGYEHEFVGKAKGTTYGVYDIEESSVKGGTGVATLGLRYQPAANQRLNIDLKGSGYFGKREGGSALLKVDYKF